jgi:hypothetical protein
MFPQQSPISVTEPEPEPQPQPSGVDKKSILIGVAGALAVIFVVAMLYLMFDMRSRVIALEQKQQAIQAQQVELTNRLAMTSSQFKEQLSSEVGLTKQQMAERAAELERQQEQAAARLSAAQSRQSKQLAEVSGEVSNVKTDVGSAKTDIQKTQSDLQVTNTKLEQAMSDIRAANGLIAHNSTELEVLKHKGDRNYYDFTLQKGARTPISTVSLQLKKVDAKKGKFTLNVIADDRTIEKKDRTMNEPLQFYTGRDHMLYEVVVFGVDKNSITGYLSTPKNAPTPVTP